VHLLEANILNFSFILLLFKDFTSNDYWNCYYQESTSYGACYNNQKFIFVIIIISSAYFI